MRNYAELDESTHPEPYLAPLQALDFSGRMKRGTVPFGPKAVAAAPAGLRGGLGAEVALCAASDTCGLAAVGPAAGLDVRRANFCVLFTGAPTAAA